MTEDYGQPDRCPDCGSRVADAYDARKHCADPGIHVRYNCGTSYYLPTKGRVVAVPVTTTELSGGTTLPATREIPPVWQIFGRPGYNCLFRQVEQFKEERQCGECS